MPSLRGFTLTEVARDALKTLAGESAVFVFQFNSEIAPTEKRGGNASAARAGKRIEHEIAGTREAFDERRQDADGLFGRMDFVAGIFPRLHVIERLRRLGGIAFDEHVSLLVTRIQVANVRGVVFVPDNMADSFEPGSPPRVKERIDLAPAVEGNAERVGFQNAIEIGESSQDAFGTIIVCDGAPVAA